MQIHEKARRTGRLLIGIAVVAAGLAAACTAVSAHNPSAVSTAAWATKPFRIIPTYGSPFSGDRKALATAAQLSAIHDLSCTEGDITVTDVNGGWGGGPQFYVTDGCKQRLLYVVQIGEIEVERRFILVSRMAL